VHSFGACQVRQLAVHAAICSGECTMMWTDRKSLVVSVMAGALLWIPLIAVNKALGNPDNDAWTLWYWVGYPALLALLFGIGFRRGVHSWRNGLAAMFSSYLTALLLVAHTGNLLPFEVLVMGAMSLPAIIVERIGARLGVEERGDPEAPAKDPPIDRHG
jgi:hypothetical protein